MIVQKNKLGLKRMMEINFVVVMAYSYFLIILYVLPYNINSMSIDHFESFVCS